MAILLSQIVESQSDLITNCSWSVKISKEAFNKSRLENNGTAFVGVLRFKNLRNKVLHATVFIIIIIFLSLVWKDS